MSDMEEELRIFANIQLKQRKELAKVMKRRRARFRWKRGIRASMINDKTTAKFSSTVKYFMKYREEEIIRKDKEYLSKILRNYSTENVFVAATLEGIQGMDEEEEEYHLMNNLLMGQTNVHNTVATRQSSRNELINQINNVHIDEEAIRKFYARHIKELLGKRYTEYDDDELECEDYDGENEDCESNQSNDATPRHSLEPKEPDILEYAIKYEVRSKKHRIRILHFLVVEGKTHWLLSKLSSTPPIIIPMSLKSVKKMGQKQKFNKIVSTALLHLYKNENLAYWFKDNDDNNMQSNHKSKSDVDGVAQKGKDKNKSKDGDNSDDDPDDILEKNPNRYTELIAKHLSTQGNAAFDFLHPRKVCLVVLETQPEDEESAELEIQYFHPLNNPNVGWLTKPIRRLDKVNKTIAKIDYILNSEKEAKTKGQDVRIQKSSKDMVKELAIPPDSKLVTLNEIMTRTELLALRDKLMETPADIVYKGDEDNDDDDIDLLYKDSLAFHQDSDANLKDIVALDGSPLNLTIRSYHQLFHDRGRNGVIDVDMEKEGETRKDSMWANKPKGIYLHKHSPSDPGSFRSNLMSGAKNSTETAEDAMVEYQNFQKHLMEWKEIRHSLRHEQGQQRDHQMLIAEPHPHEEKHSGGFGSFLLSPFKKKEPIPIVVAANDNKRLSVVGSALSEEKRSSSQSNLYSHKHGLIMHRSKPESKDGLSLTGMWSRHSQLADEGVRDVHFHYEHQHNYHHNVKKLKIKHLWKSRKNDALNNETDFIYKKHGKVLEVKKKKEKIVFARSYDSIGSKYRHTKDGEGPI